MLLSSAPISELQSSISTMGCVDHQARISDNKAADNQRLDLHLAYNLLAMVLILDGNLEIGAHVRCNFCYFTCLRHLIECSHKSDFYFFRKDLLSYMRACATCPELPSSIITLLPVSTDSRRYIQAFILGHVRQIVKYSESHK